MNTITVIIPAESIHTGSPVLSCLKNIDYPQDNIEIIMSVGNWPSSQRNQAARVAQGQILYFFNRDARPEPGIFKKMVSIMDKDAMIAGVGGVDITPADNNYLQHLFGYAMSSYFAHWKMRSRYTPTGKEKVACEKELLLSNMAVKKEVFLASGGFNEGLYPNEENELINRISGMGYKFIYSPDIKICRDRRKGIFKFMQQFYSYGEGRLNQMRTEGVLKNIQFLIPLCFLFYSAFLFFVGNEWLLRIPMFVYLTLAAIDSIYLSLKNRKNLVILPAIYLIMHFSYAFGMLSGICKNIVGHKVRLRPGINHSIIYIKTMG